jgi:periplasmic protein TonB
MPYAPQQASSTRLAGIGLVVLLHVAVIYALVTALAHRAVEVVRAPIETKIIDEVKEQRPEPPPPPPDLAPPPPAFVPLPEIRIETPPPPSPKSTAITVVTPEMPVAPPPPPVAALRVMPKLDAQRSHEPEYPPTSRRLGEQGSLIMQVLIDADGRVVDSKLLQSSGFERLDQAALEDVKRDYRFIPGTVDGKPAEMWYTFRFSWKLK